MITRLPERNVYVLSYVSDRQIFVSRFLYLGGELTIHCVVMCFNFLQLLKQAVDFQGVCTHIMTLAAMSNP
jgi:hypothetical protein